MNNNPRKQALLVCEQVIDKGRSINDLLDYYFKDFEDNRDKAFCNELCIGFCRFYYLLTHSLKGLMQKPLKARDKQITLILLLGMYQIRFMRVENHAAVNESVKLLNKKNQAWARGLVNGVLRNYIRLLEKQGCSSELTDSEDKLCWPSWMSLKIAHDWPDAVQAIFSSANHKPAMVLRVNTDNISRNNYLEKLDSLSIKARKHTKVETAIILGTAQSVDDLPGFAEGDASVQDASAQLAATLLDCKQGMRVLDACAAPGGKTMHILQSVKGIQMTAIDKEEKRLKRIKENLQRAQVSADLICADAAETDSWFDGDLYDRILLDVPCSASGIIRRHPDIRLLRKQNDISGLVQQQKRLLHSMWAMLKPGGKLLYSTCSIFKEENELQVKNFLNDQPASLEIPISHVSSGVQRLPGQQIFPGFDEMDGFYYACLQKQPETLEMVNR